MTDAVVQRRTLRQMVIEVVAALPEGSLQLYPDVETIEDDHVWVDFAPFVLSIHEDGWELADGDPVCNWCGNSFTEVFPHDVAASRIVEKIVEQITGPLRECNSSDPKVRSQGFAKAVKGNMGSGLGAN